MGYLALVNGKIYTAAASNRESKPGVLMLRGASVVGSFASLDIAQAAVGTSAKTIDISGMTALPGLIDCHVHLFFGGGYDMVSNSTRDSNLAARRAVAHLQRGVTTVRDLGAPAPEVFELRRRIESGETPGPRVVAAGPLLTVPGGHGEFVGLPVQTRAELHNAVRSLATAGADCIKVAVSGGVSTPGSDLLATQFSFDDLRSTVEVAHELGLPVAGHASNPNAVRIAALAEFDSIEHAVMLDDAAIDVLGSSTATLVPTLTATNLPETFFEDARIPDYIREKARVVVPRHRVSIRRAVAGGIPIAAGTDAGTTATAHGLVSTEAHQLAECGLRPHEVLDAVTRNGAALLGLGDHVGTLRARRARRRGNELPRPDDMELNKVHYDAPSPWITAAPRLHCAASDAHWVRRRPLLLQTMAVHIRRSARQHAQRATSDAASRQALGCCSPRRLAASGRDAGLPAGRLRAVAHALRMGLDIRGE